MENIYRFTQLQKRANKHTLLARMNYLQTVDKFAGNQTHYP